MAALDDTSRTTDEATRACGYAQKWLWALDSVLADRSEYNVYQAMRVRGELDVERLRTAAEIVTGRHELLRTCYRLVEGELTGVVLPVDGGILHRLAAESADAAVELALTLVGRPFELGAERPIRLWAIELTPADWVVVLCSHHIAVDAWSVDILWRELGLAYNGEPLPATGPSQEEIVGRETALREDEFYAEDVDYWREELAGWTPLEIPADRPRPARRSGRGAQVELSLAAGETAELAEFAAGRGTTPFLVAAAAVLLTLARWTGRPDVAVGTVVSGRDDVDLETAVGYFVNTVVIRNRLGERDTVEEFTGRVRDTALEAFSRAQVPFADLATEAGASRDPSRNPLVDVLLTYVEDGPHRFALGGYPVEPVVLPALSTKFDLSITFTLRPEGLSVSLAYATDLFDAATALRFIGHVRTALREFRADPGQPLGTVALLDPAEQRQVVEECNDTEEPIDPRRIEEIFADWARLTPDAPAVRCGAETWSYRELDRAAAGIADRLRRQGIGRGDRVAVRLERTPRLLPAILGVLQAGAIYVPVDPALPVERIRLLLEHSDPALVLTDELLAGWSGDAEPAPAGVTGSAEEPAYVIHTSGSTGRPHGVVVAHRGVVNLSTDLARRFGWGPGEVVAAVAPHSFDMSVPELISPLLAGAAIRLVPREAAYDPARLAGELRGVTFAQLTPSHWQALLDHGWSDRRLRAACGAEVFPAALAARLRAAVGELWNLYGPTETTVWSTTHRVDELRPGRPVPIGVPLANTTALVLDGNLLPVPVGVVGELFLGGAGLAHGYRGAPARTATRFVPDPFHPGERLYRTGDLVRRLADGALEFQARADEQVKVRGFRIEPGEVEAALERHPDVIRAAVTALGADADRRLAGFLVLRDGGDPAAVRGFAAALLPGYLVPSVLVRVDRLPLSANGKVDRASLPREVDAPHREPQPPRTDAERSVAAAFRRVLGTDEVGAGDDFFALGGHSLNAVRVVAALRPEFGARMELRLLFEHPTVAGLAARLAEAEVTEPEPAPPDTGPAPLTFLQRKMWLRERAMTGGRPECNVPRALRLSGALDPDALERGLHAVAARHDVLRSSYLPREDDPEEPYQAVNADPPPLLRSAMPDFPTALALAVTDCEAVFDLTEGPLWRARLIRITDTDHLLVLVFHHMVVDGPSFPLLWRELAVAYRGEPLPPATFRFADFARTQLGRPVSAEDLDYWRGRLDGWPTTELPRAHPKPEVPTKHGADLEFRVPPAVAEGLRDVARAHRTTVFTVLLAAYTAVTSHLCGQEDLVLGSPLSARDRPEFEDLIGVFANMMALRLDCTGDPGFRELVNRAHATVAEAKQHQRLPFGRMAEEFAAAGEPGRKAPFQVAFVVADAESLVLPGVRAEDVSVPVPIVASGYEVIVELYERAGGYDGWIVWNPDNYDREPMAELAEYYGRVLGTVARQPWSRLSELAPEGAAPAGSASTEGARAQ